MGEEKGATIANRCRKVKRITQLETVLGPDICRKEESFPTQTELFDARLGTERLDGPQLNRILALQGQNPAFQSHQITDHQLVTTRNHLGQMSGCGKSRGTSPLCQHPVRPLELSAD